ncbi:hypothetical protein ES332_A11G391200v1 [Gossypium tomentosum]|uniref:Uncharacterized protein n=1 Tax=Gossypium tomentosum TaxID=34277 RepID=A0A5D2NPE9_GOSTO|nr:hypothetical protein ES332_A11G391200v1 [Gossypium tomentosum]
MLFLEITKEMAEKFLMAASMAALVCHPSSSINCFKPKPQTSQRTTSNSAKKNTDIQTDSSLSKTSSSCSSFSDTNTTPTPRSHVPNRVPLRTSCKDLYLVSSLFEKDPAFRVVETIFKSGWDVKTELEIEKILKINHTIDVLKRFEEYREIVKSKSSNIERLAVDGNEVLKFYGTIVTCSLGIDEFSRICYRESCGVCRMIGLRLSEVEESVGLSDDSRCAHRKVTKECGVDNKVRGRKVVVVCRVIAGRMARCRGRGVGLVEGREGGFDSVVSSCTDRSEELVVLDARAVLPCFVIVYNVKHLKGYKV